MICSLLLLLSANVVGAEDDAVDDDEDECLFNIGDREWVRAAEYKDTRLVDIGERRNNVGDVGEIHVAADDDDDWEDEEEDLVDEDSTESDKCIWLLAIPAVQDCILMGLCNDGFFVHLRTV